jgi:hypothetical protein
MHPKNTLLHLPDRCRIVLLAAALLTWQNAAAQTAWPKAKFDYVAQKQDLRQVLRDFASNMRVQLDLADEVEGSVTGKFDMPPPVLLDLLGSYHHFNWYFDGAVLYVGSSKPGAPKMRMRSKAPDAPPVVITPAPPPGPVTERYLQAATVAAVAPIPAPSARSWDIRLEDGTLSATLTRWAVDEGWQLLWEMPVDFQVDASSQVDGSFEQAVGVVATSLATAPTPMQVIFYRGNHVVRIVAKGTP